VRAPARRPSSRAPAHPILRGVSRELQCPVCNVDLPLAGDERSGDEVYCVSCGAPCVLKGDPSEADCVVEEDF